MSKYKKYMSSCLDFHFQMAACSHRLLVIYSSNKDTYTFKFKFFEKNSNPLSFITTQLNLCSAISVMIAKNSSCINDENQGEVVFHWFVVFGRCKAQRSQSKALWSLLQHLARTAPSTRSDSTGPKTTWKNRQTNK